MSGGYFEVRTPTGSFMYKINDSTTEIKVGRSPDGNDIIVSDSECSRWHMRFDVVRGELMAYDLSSANGTFVGETRIDGGFGHKIANKDVVVIGVSQLKYHAPARKFKDAKAAKPKSKPKSKPSYSKNRGHDAEPESKFVRELNKAKKGVGARAAGNAGYDNAALKVEVIQKIKPRGKMSYEQMVDMWREDNEETLANRSAKGFIMAPNSRIRVVVRKRPLGRKERDCYDIASTVTSKSQQAVVIHEPKEAVDLTKYMDNHVFQFDQVLNEEVGNRAVYYSTAYPLIPFVFKGRNATCFAYGQTGSGKTYTMAGEGHEKGVYHMAAEDIFKLRAESYPELMISASFFEIYGGQVYDLLNNRARLLVQEDGRQQVCVTGLTEFAMESVEEVLSMITEGNNVRQTGATSANDTSSRSHAIMQFVLRRKGRYKNPVVGKLSIIDLAGSERGKDTSAMDRRRRMEGAEINKSLLALKECIRALSVKQSHTPFRASKLTQVLKDSFIGKSRTVMIATISPASMNAEHTCNTLRYADRVKELSKRKKKGPVDYLPFPDEASFGQSAAAISAQAPEDEDEDEGEEDIVDEDVEPDAGGMHDVDDAEDDAKAVGMAPDQLNYSIIVTKMIKSEAMLLMAHQQAFDHQEEVAGEERKLIEAASKGADDYDLDTYVRKMREIITAKKAALQECEQRLEVVEKLMRDEEAAVSSPNKR